MKHTQLTCSLSHFHNPDHQISPSPDYLLESKSQALHLKHFCKKKNEIILTLKMRHFQSTGLYFSRIAITSHFVFVSNYGNNSRIGFTYFVVTVLNVEMFLELHPSIFDMSTQMCKVTRNVSRITSINF